MGIIVAILCISLYILSIEAGSLQDVEHIVIFMQENRAYDHYYGTMKGVRGFNDRSAPLLPNGRSPFHQPTNPKNDSQYMLPFYLNFSNTSATCMGAPAMAYSSDIHIWNNGKMDAWNTARSPGFGMSFFNRSDLPFYYRLADYYLVGDNYYQSTFTATNPNRLHLFSGSNGLSVNSKYDILDDSEPNGINWITMAEVLQKAGITWRVYQEADNFDDNGFAWFDNFKQAKPGSVLYDQGMYRAPNLLNEFANDVRNKSLPQVSWIVGPSHASEHATNHPQDGEALSASLLNILGAKENADIYNKTIFILNYDEGGQFYDHLWIPTAPMNATDGKSTVSTEGEVTKKSNFGIPPGHPIGPGFRVPFWIISPWTRADGGIVFSQVSDHTSVIKLIEKRFNVTCPNISPWRRAVMSDLLYAFDFDNPNYDFPSDLPDTSNNTKESAYECAHNPPPKVPTIQWMPTQEVGTRISRNLPYKFNISDNVDTGKKVINISMANIGVDAAVVFHVFDYIDPLGGPKKYTIEVNKQLWDTWDFHNGNKYNLSLHGPNGYVRTFASSNGLMASYKINMIEDAKNQNVIFEIICAMNKCDNKLIIEDKGYGNDMDIFRNDEMDNRIVKNVGVVGNWYDYLVREMDEIGNVWFERRFMGRVETGKDSISDPAMGVPRTDKDVHPDIKSYWNDIIHNSWNVRPVCKNRAYKQNEFVKDVCWKEK
eukprot:80629_1